MTLSQKSDFKEGDFILIKLQDETEFYGWIKEVYPEGIFRIDDSPGRRRYEKEKEYEVFVSGSRFYSIKKQMKKISEIKEFIVL